MKTFNAQKRREIKRECRSRVSARLGTCIGANFLYGLPIVLVLLIVYITMFGSSFSLMLAGADETAVAQAMMRGTGVLPWAFSPRSCSRSSFPARCRSV